MDGNPQVNNVSPGARPPIERRFVFASEPLHEGISERERLKREAKDAERGLREVRERFKSAFDNAPIGMALIAMDDRWLQVNDALCRITGQTGEALKATTLRAMTHPDDIDLDAQSMRQLLAGQIPSYQVEKRLRHAWGHHVWVLVTASIVRDEEDGPCTSSRKCRISPSARSSRDASSTSWTTTF